ncbi:MAG: Xaa-Pro dipeptidase, partial [Bacteroidaceae bacterium]|nr:Xaa-Pro dipeptidase [Bacteroidaceae bacterium]
APYAEAAKWLQKAMQHNRQIHFLKPYRPFTTLQIHDMMGLPTAEISKLSSQKLVMAVIKQRNKKEPQEIAELDKAFEIGYAMHTAALRMCRPGEKEQHIAGTMEGIALSMGQGLSFPTILTQHGEVLHNHKPCHTLESGKLMLADAGGENSEGYCSDHTRTTPVSGKFTQRQKEVYQIVVDCHDYALTVAKPGNTWKQVHLDTCKVMFNGLKALGLTQGDTEEAVAAGAHALFMPHGLGHMMGMDVHDMENLGQQYVGYDEETRPSTQFGLASLRMGRRLEEGFVITDEPGIYFIPDLIDLWKSQHLHEAYLNYEAIEKYKDFGGIRIEDDVIITATGSRFCGDKVIPYHVDELETYLANRD